MRSIDTMKYWWRLWLGHNEVLMGGYIYGIVRTRWGTGGGYIYGIART